MGQQWDKGDFLSKIVLTPLGALKQVVSACPRWRKTKSKKGPKHILPSMNQNWDAQTSIFDPFCARGDPFWPTKRCKKASKRAS